MIYWPFHCSLGLAENQPTDRSLGGKVKKTLAALPIPGQLKRHPDVKFWLPGRVITSLTAKRMMIQFKKVASYRECSG